MDEKNAVEKLAKLARDKRDAENRGYAEHQKQVTQDLYAQALQGLQQGANFFGDQVQAGLDRAERVRQARFDNQLNPPRLPQLPQPTNVDLSRDLSGSGDSSGSSAWLQQLLQNTSAQLAARRRSQLGRR